MKDIHLYKKLHEDDPTYGNSGHIYFETIKNFMIKHNPSTILDFGSGKGSLARRFKSAPIVIDEYDPAIPGKELIPKDNYDMIISTDFFEHLYPEEIEEICLKMLSLNPETMYHLISHRPAAQILDDGSNAHKTIETPRWWAEKFKSIFKEYTINYTVSNVGCFKLVKSS